MKLEKSIQCGLTVPCGLCWRSLHHSREHPNSEPVWGVAITNQKSLTLGIFSWPYKREWSDLCVNFGVSTVSWSRPICGRVGNAALSNCNAKGKRHQPRQPLEHLLAAPLACPETLTAAATPNTTSNSILGDTPAKNDTSNCPQLGRGVIAMESHSCCFYCIDASS